MREQQPEWRDLAHALRRLRTGDHDPDRDPPETLLSGLDDVDTAIVRRALDLLTGRDDHDINPDTWTMLTDTGDSDGDDEQSEWLETFVAACAAAATGDATARAQVEPVLGEMSDDPDWAAFATALGGLLDNPDGAEPAAGDHDDAGDDLTPDQTALLDAVRAAIRDGGRAPRDPDTEAE